MRDRRSVETEGVITMLIDAHCHIWRREWLEGDLVRALDSVNDQMRYKDRDNIFDGSLERLIADMDEAVIDKTGYYRWTTNSCTRAPP